MKPTAPVTACLLGLISLPSASAVTFSPNATYVACPAASSPSSPTQIADFTGGKLLIAPTVSEGDLCILSRVNGDAAKKVYIPIARSYDGNDWHRVQGRYISYVDMQCGESAADGAGYSAGDYLCEVQVPELNQGNLGYFLTKWEEGTASHRRLAARFLERATWGANWDEITTLENAIAANGQKALAQWIQTQHSLTPSSHRKFFRERLSPRAVESYIYGIPGPKACEDKARFRRFAFTYKDLEMSRSSSTHVAGSTGQPMTPVEIETVNVSGVNHYALKFGGEVRTVLPEPLQYDDNGSLVTLADGSYTICYLDELVGYNNGNVIDEGVQFQLLVGDLCTSSYTNRGGVADGKGDGATSDENVKVGSTHVRYYDKNQCDAKCGSSNAKYIQGGNPEVIIPDGFDTTTLSWVDLSTLDTNTEIININADRQHDASFLLLKDLDNCQDANGDDLPDPAGLAYIDYLSYGRGKYNLDKPIFAKLPGNKWALHDFRTQFKANTPDNPLEDGGGTAMKAAARSGANDDGNPDTDLVVRCSNVQRNIFNEAQCRISYHQDACQSVPLPDPDNNYRVLMLDPGTPGGENLRAYTPEFAGPDNGGVVVCGSENEVAPIPTEDDHFDVTNRKMEPGPINPAAQKSTVWLEVVLGAEDQLCQRLAFGLSKIFATSTDTNPDSGNSETNIGVYDNFVNACFSTYKDVIKRASFNQEMSEQLTFKYSKSVASDWHRWNKLAWPDENYARENLQLHSIGLVKLNDDGTPVLDRFGKRVANYEQKHIFEAAKVWTSFGESYRRANYEDLDWTTASYLDPLQIKEASGRDWFPKITSDGGYLGDRYPLCADLPLRHFLRQGATFRLLGGSSIPLSHSDPASWEGNEEIQRFTLHPSSPLYSKLCNPTNAALPSSTLTAGSGIAEYDATLTAPLCQGSSSSCDSNTLLVGRVGETNGPNTIDDCSDGTDTNANYTEAVNRIVLSSVDGNDLRGGDLVKIEATVNTYSKQDRVDYYFAADADNPDWKLIAIVAPLQGESVVTVPYSTFPDVTFTLPKCTSESGCKQAVRVVLRSSRSGARRDGQHKPPLACGPAIYDDADDIAFEVLPSARPRDTCSFQTLVTLDSNLDCQGRECGVSTLRVVEVMSGVFYEYIPPPCVHLPFYNDAVKVMAGWDNALAMCADKRIASARSTCCGTYSDRDLVVSDWADVLSEYRGERLTYDENEKRCAAWGRSSCDPARIGPFFGQFGHCLHRQACMDVGGGSVYLEGTAWHWSTASCDIKVLVDPDGRLAIFHNPAETKKSYGSSGFPLVQSHVHVNKTVSYFNVQWDTTNVGVGKLEYPHVTDNACDGGAISDDLCVCDTTVTTTAVFDSLPTRESVLSSLFVGAFDPMVMQDTYTALVEATSDDGVSVFKKASSSNYNEDTIFRVKDEHTGDYIFLKNVQSKVSVCEGTFFFRNSPTFYDNVDPQLFSAYQEVDAYLDYVDKHSNTPPFVCKTLLKHFGFPNASPHHVLGCSDAYKSGVYTWTNPTNSSDIVSYGSGDRGDLRAVSASILLGRDSLSPTLDVDPAHGGLKEPLHKLMQLMRSFEFQRSLTHKRTRELLSLSAQDILGQAPYGTPDQFSFFSPEYMPAGAHIESALVLPESELLNMKYAIGSQNAYYYIIQYGLNRCWGGIGANLSPGRNCNDPGEAAGYLTFNPQGDTSSGSNVVSQLATLLTADRLDDASKSIIESVYSTVLASDGEQGALKAAQILMVSAPTFHATNKAEPLTEKRASTAGTPKDESEPYKAVIHLNLFGGMDSMNLLVPHPDGCPSLYEEYKARRGDLLHLSVNELIKIDASTSDQPCSSFGVNKYLGQNFVDLYSAGEMMFVANVGHLQKPVTAANFLAETKTQLFSHHTMKEESFKVDAFKERDDTGILGRMADILGNSLSTSKVSLDGNSDILVGDPTLGLKVDVMGGRGPDQFYSRDVYGIKESILSLNNLTSEGNSIHADLWSQNLIDSYNKSDNYLNMLETVSGSNLFSSSGLGRQFQMVLRLIKLREARGINRDSFAISLGGFDTHFDLKSVLQQKFEEIGPVLRGFRDALKDIGVWDSVTVVVSSEFGRTVTPNTSGGTDHGWGGVHTILGGNLNGGKIIGHHPPTYESDWKYNTGRGVWIPTTSNEGMWFGIAQWFGLRSNIALNYALPNMNNFGCRLYSETDLFKEGTGTVPGCGGDVMTFNQVFYLSEPRLMNPDEQKSFCAKVYDAINGISVKCVILNQIIAARNTGSRRLNELGYTLDVEYEISSDSSGVSSTIADVVNSNEFKANATTSFDMQVSIESAQVVATPTQSPSKSPSSSPSSSPSTSPSASPSKSPSSSPSQSPTLSPSSPPSASPLKSPNSSQAPSTSPSESPTGQPSVLIPTITTTAAATTTTTTISTTSSSASPSHTPSRTLSSTESPYSSPSSSPSRSTAISSSPTKGPTKSPLSSTLSGPTGKLEYMGRLALTGIDCSGSSSDIRTAANDAGKSARSVICSQVTGINCGASDVVLVSKICGRYVNADSSSRRLSSEDNDAYFSLILYAVESDLRQKDSLIGQYLQGSSLNNILTAIQNDIVSSSSTQTLGSITAIYYTFIDSIIRGLGLFYPDWGRTETCADDGNQPDYMNRFPDHWMYSNIEDCCSRYFSWDVASCLGSSSSYVDPTSDLYYPDWGGSKKCINDGNAPAYMKKGYTSWMYDSLTDCCARYYTWEDDYNDCVVSGGGSITTPEEISTSGNKWYVQYSTLSCVKSCSDQNTSSCGGVAQKWYILYPSKEQCCQQRLWWLGNSCVNN